MFKIALGKSARVQKKKPAVQWFNDVPPQSLIAKIIASNLAREYLMRKVLFNFAQSLG